MAKKKAAKKKAKRYSEAEKKEILDFIEAQGRGGQTKAVKKFKVTAATIASWKKKAGGDVVGNGRSSSGTSKEQKILAELSSTLTEIEATKDKLTKLEKHYQKLKSRL